MYFLSVEDFHEGTYIVFVSFEYMCDCFGVPFFVDIFEDGLDAGVVHGSVFDIFVLYILVVAAGVDVIFGEEFFVFGDLVDMVHMRVWVVFVVDALLVFFICFIGCTWCSVDVYVLVEV